MAPARFAFFIFLTACAPALAQFPTVDSLAKRLPHTSGKLRVDILNELTYQLISRNNARAMSYGSEAFELSRRLHYPTGEAGAHIYKGVYEYLSGEFSDGRINLRTGLQLAEKIQDRRFQGYALLQLGNSYLNQAVLDSALTFYTLAYSILKDSTNPLNLSKLYKNMSTLYGLQAKRSLQLKYIKRALRIREYLNDKSFVADALIDLADVSLGEADYESAVNLLDKAEKMIGPTDLENLNDLRHQRALILLQERRFDEASLLLDSARDYYFRNSLLHKFVTLQADLGKIFYERGQYEVALKNLYDALRVAELKGYEVQVITVQVQLGWVNFQLGELHQSLLMADSALVLAEKKKMPNHMADALTLKGVVLTEFRDYPAARLCLNQVLTIRRGLDDRARISEALLNLGELEEKIKNYPKALDYYHQSLDLAELSKYDFGKTWCLVGLGSASLALGVYENADRFLAQAETYAREIRANEALIRVYALRRDLLAAEHRYEESLHYSILSDHLKDSLHRHDLARRFVNLQKIDEIERRDRDIKVLTQERQLAREKMQVQDEKLRQQYILIVGATAALALLAALVFVYARFYLRIKRLNHALGANSVRIQAQADELLQVNGELNRVYQAVTEQKKEIQSQADQLVESYNRLHVLNQNLEELVVEKTQDLQKTNEELARHNTELLQFSYTVSHNLRGPVARLLGLTNLLRHSTSEHELAQMTNLVHKTSTDLDLVLRDLSKIIDFRNDLLSSKERVNLAEEWQNCCALLQDAIREQFRISADFNEVPFLVTIKAIIHSVFYNLLSNAIKYRSPDRNLIVAARSYLKGETIILEIADNGLGLDVEQYRDSLFKLFKRFHSHVEGRGMGLYLIKSQVEALRGAIEVDSAPDIGTKFSIIFPIAVLSAPGGAPAPHAVSAQTSR
jgi:signal transduction histidine kinase